MIGETRHPLYITLHPPIGNGPYNETCVWLGCTAARGKTTEESVFNAIWNKFQSMNVTTRDGRLLSYYKYGDNAGYVTELNGLLISGNGQCASWADLFQKVIYAQGINSIYKYVIDIKNNKNIYILMMVCMI